MANVDRTIFFLLIFSSFPGPTDEETAGGAELKPICETLKTSLKKKSGAVQSVIKVKRKQIKPVK